jgi:hypothetical protein
LIVIGGGVVTRSIFNDLAVALGVVPEAGDRTILKLTKSSKIAFSTWFNVKLFTHTEFFMVSL